MSNKIESTKPPFPVGL